MYVVRENRDGTVTIDRKVYEELHRRACTERTDWVPLTPNMRAAVNNSIDQHIAGLNACEGYAVGKFEPVRKRSVEKSY